MIKTLFIMSEHGSKWIEIDPCSTSCLCIMISKLHFMYLGDNLSVKQCNRHQQNILLLSCAEKCLRMHVAQLHRRVIPAYTLLSLPHVHTIHWFTLHLQLNFQLNGKVSPHETLASRRGSGFFSMGDNLFFVIVYRLF